MARAPNLFTLVYNALLRPARFAAYLASGRRAIAWAALAMCEALLVLVGFVMLVLGQLLPLGVPALVYGLGLAPILALMIAGVCIIVSSNLRLSPVVSAAFWIIRCQLAITPTLALLLTLAYSSAFPQLQQAPAIIMFLLILVGVWCGGAITVILALHPHHSESVLVRWLLASGALIIGGALWFSPPLHATSALLLVPACIGLMIGLLHPLSYMWEALVSMALWLATGLGVPVNRMLPLHPVNYDDLCLLPLPGLSSLLARAFTADLEEGGEMLLQVAQHLGQSGAAGRAIKRTVCSGQLAHPLLFWLSTSAPGAALLRELSERSTRPHPLIEAYAAFAHPGSPDAWPALIASRHAAFANATDLPGGAAILALLETGAGTLGAARWGIAIDRLRSAPAPNSQDDAVWIALDIVQIWARDQLPALAEDRAAALRALREELHDLEGWPVALIAAISEHLLYLLNVERRRGAWLV